MFEVILFMILIFTVFIGFLASRLLFPPTKVKKDHLGLELKGGWHR